MNDYWVGRKIDGTNAAIVYDSSVQISDVHVFLFNVGISSIEQLDRKQARSSITKISAPHEREAATQAYRDWLTRYAGEMFLKLIRTFKNGAEIPNYLYRLYDSGYRDGYAQAPERVFDARMPEICRREYNRGYMDGSNDIEVQQSLTALNEFDDEDDYGFGGFIDSEREEDRRRQLISQERSYIDNLLRPRTTQTQDEYDQYLKSDHWLLSRINALVKAQFRCQSCSERQKLEVHHKTYLRRGEELPSDLIVLCYWCHRKLHLGKFGRT